jgi:hypothetical protein
MRIIVIASCLLALAATPRKALLDQKGRLTFENMTPAEIAALSSPSAPVTNRVWLSYQMAAVTMTNYPPLTIQTPFLQVVGSLRARMTAARTAKDRELIDQIQSDINVLLALRPDFTFDKNGVVIEPPIFE